MYIYPVGPIRVQGDGSLPAKPKLQTLNARPPTESR